MSAQRHRRARQRASLSFAAGLVVVAIAALVAEARESSDALDMVLRGTHAIDRAILDDASRFVDAAAARAIDETAPRGERLRALSVIAAVKQASLDGVVRSLSDDSDPEVRRVARHVQYARASGSARRVLLDEMRIDPDPRLREIAVDQLARAGEVAALRAAAHDDVDPAVRQRAARRLARLATRTTDEIEERVDDRPRAKALSR